MLVTTTDIIQDREIAVYKGIVNGQAIVGAHVVKDFFASMRDFFGGRSRAYEKTIAAARHEAIADMVKEATSLGSSAIVGMDIEYQVIGKSNSMLMVCVTGTAVTFR